MIMNHIFNVGTLAVIPIVSNVFTMILVFDLDHTISCYISIILLSVIISARNDVSKIKNYNTYWNPNPRYQNTNNKNIIETTYYYSNRYDRY